MLKIVFMNTRKAVQNFFIFSLLLLFLAACVAMIYPFFTVVLWTVFIYIIFRPLHAKFNNKLNPNKKFYSLKRNLLATLFSVGILLLIITPIIFIALFLFNELKSFLIQILDYISANPNLFDADGPFEGLYNFIQGLGIDIPNFKIEDMQSYVMEFLSTYSSKLVGISTKIVSKTGNFIMSLVFIVFALYFCFLDGPYLDALVKKALPVKKEYMNILSEKFTKITKNLFSGYILVALYQGAAAFILMLIFRVQGALLFSVILMFCSFVPIVGTAAVWLPVGIVLIITQSPFTGALFLVLCAIFVSTMDNFIRPFLLKDRINVHPLIIFFAILGGLAVFGLNGLILGPLTVILFFTVLDMLLHTKDLPDDDEEDENEADILNG